MLRGGAGAGGDDEVGVAEQPPLGVGNAGHLLARHGVAADEIHPVRQAGRGLHDGGFHAAHVGDQRAGLETVLMLLQESGDPRRVLAEHHHVRPGQLRPGAGGDPVSRPLFRRLLPDGRGPIHPHNLKVLKAPESHGKRAADEAQAHH